MSEFTTSSGPGGTSVASLDGVATTPAYGWRVRVNGSAARAESGEPIGFGDLVFLRYGATVADPGPAPKVTVPPVEPVKRRAVPGARISIRGEARWRDGGIEVEARCPRGLGAGGCRGLLTRAVPRAPRRTSARRRLRRV